MSAVTDWTVETLVHALARRKISPVEATRECLNRIERLDGKIHAFQRVTAWHLEPPRFSGRGGPVIG